ncbi:hypothetical protein QOT17_013885 [Balamuthia mandrillaris]
MEEQTGGAGVQKQEERVTATEMKQLIVALNQMNERLGNVVEHMERASVSLDNFTQTQEALNISLNTFKAIFEVTNNP